MAGTVLIVEDDAPTRKLLDTLMLRSGLASVIAADGAAAITILNGRDDIACIILDLMMPSVDGWSVMAHLTATERKIPVIVCTAAGPQSTGGLDPEIVCAVVRKPFDIEELAATVVACMRNA
jgi:CheY-like chemotaxis protein